MIPVVVELLEPVVRHEGKHVLVFGKKASGGNGYSGVRGQSKRLSEEVGVICWGWVRRLGGVASGDKRGVFGHLGEQGGCGLVVEVVTVMGANGCKWLQMYIACGTIPEGPWLLISF